MIWYALEELLSFKLFDRRREGCCGIEAGMVFEARQAFGPIVKGEISVLTNYLTLEISI
jgi:hypothetical protein